MKSKWVRVLLLILLALPSEGQYQVAKSGYAYEFPRDYFNHPKFQTEWWYYTGNVKSADKHRFGFELTFFRQGVGQDAKHSDSTWEVRHLYIAHFALSDITGQRFYHSERINRAGPGLAGVSANPGRIWNGNWQVFWSESEQRLSAITTSLRLDLHLHSEKAPVIHGLNGVTQKAAGDGHASHYVSLTRLLTDGQIVINGIEYKVDGTSWMDHEFFTNQLAADEPGWDWLSLQFSDNTELMLYRLRHNDGRIDPFSSGTYVDAEGRTNHLSSADFQLEPTGKNWTSQATKGTYPIEWRISVPSLHLGVKVSTPLQSQEMVSNGNGTPTYWEGVIDVSGARGQSPLSGVGYLEMTGYAGRVQF
jgi:predicted secreted hydrolase